MSTVFLDKSRKLRHNLGRPSRSDFVQFQFYEVSKYRYAKWKLGFVADWLIDKKNIDGKWDMGKIVNDKVYYPLSDDWRKKETREADCTERVEKLLKDLLEKEIT